MLYPIVPYYVYAWRNVDGRAVTCSATNLDSNYPHLLDDILYGPTEDLQYVFWFCYGYNKEIEKDLDFDSEIG